LLNPYLTTQSLDSSTTAMAAEQAILPIAELSAYTRQWMIKARVTNKAPMRVFTKSGGQGGKVFSADLLDADGGEIRASFFNGAADKFFDMLEKGKCFTFSKGTIKVANKQYNPFNHRYELTFEESAIVKEIGNDASIDSIKYSFVNLRTLQTRTLPFVVDLCGVLVSFKPTMSVNSKEGKELVKREITIADDSATTMTVTLWGDRAQQADSVFEGSPVVALKSVSVKEFNNSRSGSILQAGVLVFKPDFPEAKRVGQWWSQGGSSQTLVDLSAQVGGGGATPARFAAATPTTLAGLRVASEQLSGNQQELFSVVARLALVQTRKQGEPQPLHYMACQEPKEGNGFPCNKRVDEQGFCAACNRAGKIKPRLNIRCRFVDFEDQAWLSSFHEGATKILGMTGEEVRALELAAVEKGEGGREELDNTIRKKYFEKPMQVTVRAKLDSYNGETRTNVSVVDARPVSHAEHGRRMLKEINEMLSQGAQLGA